MHVARWIYGLAGVYGLLVLAPGLFTEGQIDHRPLTHPEFYYGFLGSALVWQLVFLLISSDPVRWRGLMPITFLEKLAFLVPAVALHLQARLSVGGPLIGGLIDGVLFVLFIIAWRMTPKTR